MREMAGPKCSWLTRLCFWGFRPRSKSKCIFPSWHFCWKAYVSSASNGSWTQMGYWPWGKSPASQKKKGKSATKITWQTRQFNLFINYAWLANRLRKRHVNRNNHFIELISQWPCIESQRPGRHGTVIHFEQIYFHFSTDDKSIIFSVLQPSHH